MLMFSSFRLLWVVSLNLARAGRTPAPPEVVALLPAPKGLELAGRTYNASVFCDPTISTTKKVGCTNGDAPQTQWTLGDLWGDCGFEPRFPCGVSVARDFDPHGETCNHCYRLTTRSKQEHQDLFVKVIDFFDPRAIQNETVPQGYTGKFGMSVADFQQLCPVRCPGGRCRWDWTECEPKATPPRWLNATYEHICHYPQEVTYLEYQLVSCGDI